LHAAFARHVRDIARADPTGQHPRAVLVVDNAPWHQGPLVTAALKAVPQIALYHRWLGNGYSPHAMRATCMTTALENGAKLEDVQRTVGHADPATTQLYDRGRFTPEKSAVLVVAY
jgi:integrase